MSERRAFQDQVAAHFARAEDQGTALSVLVLLLERAMGIEPTALCLGRTLVAGLIVKASDSKTGVKPG
jgi:hypothetical protein